jgi:hypothetical protein
MVLFTCDSLDLTYVSVQELIARLFTVYSMNGITMLQGKESSLGTRLYIFPHEEFPFSLA